MESVGVCECRKKRMKVSEQCDKKTLRSTIEVVGVCESVDGV